MHIVGNDSHFNSLNISLDDVLKVFLSTILRRYSHVYQALFVVLKEDIYR